MKVLSIASILALATVGTDAFQAAASSSSVSTTRTATSTSTSLYGYVPSGFTPEQYKKFKAEEAKKKAKQKNLGRMGPKGFQSRSFQSFQEALERGEATHLMPVFNANEKIKRGELRPEDIPYMQRGGSWDNRDVKNAKNQKKWLKSDKDYASGGYRKEQSVSIFGQGAGLDWTGKQGRKGPAENVPGAAPKFSKNYKAPKVNDLKTNANTNNSNDKPKKGFFGLF